MLQCTGDRDNPAHDKTHHTTGTRHPVGHYLLAILMAVLTQVAPCEPIRWRQPGYHLVPIPQELIKDETSLVNSSRDGFLWFLCGQQIIRFDGAVTRNWDVPPLQGQPFRFVDSSDGHAYVFTHNGNLLEVHEKNIQVLGKVNDNIIQAADQPLYPFITDDGYFWISGTTPILELRNGVFVDANLHNDLPFTEPVQIIRNSHNRIYAFGQHSLWQKDDGHWTQIDVATPTSAPIGAFSSDQSDNVWISRTDGVFRQQGGSWEKMDLPELVFPHSTWRLQNIPGTNDMLAFSTFKSLMLYRNGKWTNISSLIPADCSRIIRLDIDRESNIWISGWPSGVFRLTRSSLSILEFPIEISSNMVNFPYADANGELVLSTRQGLQVLSQNGEIRETIRLPGFPLTTANSILKSWDSDYWVATNRGLLRFKDSLDSSVHRERPEDPVALLTMIADKHQRIWATTSDSRVLVWADSEWQSMTFPVRDQNAYAMCATLGPDGNPWFGAWDGTLVKVQNDPLRIEVVQTPIPFETTINGLRFDTNGDLWIATFGSGIFKRTGETWHHYTRNDGLPSNSYWFVIPFHGRLIAGCNKGIVILDPETLSHQLLAKPDDLPSTDMDMINSVHQTDEDTVLVGTRKGIVKITGETLKRPALRPPRPKLLSISARNSKTGIIQSHPVFEGIQLASDTQNVHVRFTAISFSAPEMVQLKYQLQGVTDWTSTTERSTTFWNLPPGTYTFQLKALNLRGGGWSEPVSASFTILPHFWQTNWFRFLALLSILLFGVLVARLLDRLRKYLKDYRHRNFVGDYRLVSVIGKSGPATIYHASHKHFGPDVALKVIDIHDLTPDAVQRFVREGELVEKSVHTNVVRTYQRGQSGDNLFIAMERIAGHTLRHWIERGAFRLPAAIEITSTLVDTIGHLHSLGITHRDLKPENIMIRNTSGNGSDEPALPEPLSANVVLLDFGISKLVDEPAITQLDVTAGTPLYLPPESFLGKPDTDGSTDLYAIGVILYEMVTGTHPYDFRDESPYHVISRLIYNRPTPASQHASNIPEILDALIMHMIEPDPESRLSELETIRERLAACHRMC